MSPLAERPESDQPARGNFFLRGDSRLSCFPSELSWGQAAPASLVGVISFIIFLAGGRSPLCFAYTDCFDKCFVAVHDSARFGLQEPNVGTTP